MSQKTFHFGSKSIPYELKYSNRATLGITVTSDLQVIVRAPVDATSAKIENNLRKKARWILKHLDNFLIYQPKQPAKRYVGGETHLYLGRQYILRVYHGKTESVRLIGREMRVVCRDKKHVKSLVDQWYFENAKLKIQRIALPWLKYFEVYGVSPTIIRYRKMSNRWGSCLSSGTIVLNTELIKASKGSIEGVIVHELCHLVHPNHSKGFYELQSKVMPDWEKWKDRLEKALA